MTVALTMPRLGETVTEGTVVRWLKKEGDFVDKDESIVEISTAKVETEIPSPASGKVAKIVAHEDETVPVGAELAEIDETAKPGVKPEEVRPPERVEAAPAPPAAPPVPEVKAAPPKPPEVKPEEKPPEEVEAKVGFISPIVRKLAREHNIDLTQVKGTGAGGRITRDDIERYIQAREAPKVPVPPMAAPPPISLAPMPSAEIPEQEIPGRAAVEREVPVERPAPPPVEEVRPAPPPEVAPKPPEAKPAPPPRPELPGERIVEMPIIRREIAKHMVRSHQITAHVTAIVEVDMSNVSKQRDKAKGAFKQREGFSLTYLPFVAKATIDALFAFPIVNARIVDEHHMALHDYVNLGIAVAIEDGLIVPVVKNADKMNMIGLTREIRDLAEKARTGKLSPDDVVGSTFTITNPGSYGSLIQTPIINQPNVAILSLELIQRRPIVIDEAIAIRPMVYMPISYDHRLIDGAVAAQFLNRIKHNLETWDFTSELSAFM